MEDTEMPQMHKHGENTNKSNYDGNCTSCHFWFGTETISGCSISVGQSVHCNFQECNPNVKCGPTLTLSK